LVNQAEGADVEDARNGVMDMVRGHFRPEFLNRLDDILLFRRLEKSMMSKIVDIQLGRLEKLLKPRGIIVELDDKALAFLADKGYDPAYGARPLKRVIQTELQNPLAEALLKGDITDKMTVKIAYDGTSLSFKGNTKKSDKAA